MTTFTNSPSRLTLPPYQSTPFNPQISENPQKPQTLPSSSSATPHDLPIARHVKAPPNPPPPNAPLSIGFQPFSQILNKHQAFLRTRSTLQTFPGLGRQNLRHFERPPMGTELGAQLARTRAQNPSRVEDHRVPP